MSVWISRLKQYKENPHTLFLENIRDFGNFVNIPDGHRLYEEYLILANEIPGYSSMIINNKLNNTLIKKATYSSVINYEKHNIELYTLGRYFGTTLDNYIEKNTPRRYLQDTILENKKRLGLEEFTNWSNYLQLNFEDLIYYVMKTSKQNHFILTSIPNSNGNNRFEKFLKNLNKNTRFQDFNILVLSNLINTTKHENTMYKPESEKIKILRKAYSVNREYFRILQNRNFQLLIIDDVFTTGSHLKVSIEKINEVINIDVEYELLNAIANAGTKYVIDAIIMNRKRDGVNTNEIFAKNNIKDIYDKEYIKNILSKKKISYSGLFLASTQKHSNNSFNSGLFYVIE